MRSEETQARPVLGVLWTAVRVSVSTVVFPRCTTWSLCSRSHDCAHNKSTISLHRCGRAQRPDAAVKVVFAMRKEGIRPSATLSNTYFKAKKVRLKLEYMGSVHIQPFAGVFTHRFAIQVAVGHPSDKTLKPCGLFASKCPQVFYCNKRTALDSLLGNVFFMPSILDGRQHKSTLDSLFQPQKKSISGILGRRTGSHRKSPLPGGLPPSFCQ